MGRSKPTKPRRGRPETVAERVQRMQETAEAAGFFDENGVWWADDGTCVMVHSDYVATPADYPKL